MKTNIHVLSHFAQFFLEWEMFQNKQKKKCRENRNTHFTYNNFFSRKSCRLWDNEVKHGTARRATCDDMAHAHCLMDT